MTKKTGTKRTFTKRDRDQENPDQEDQEMRTKSRAVIGVSNIIDHTLTKNGQLSTNFYFSTVPVSPVKFFANIIETDNLENFLCTLYRDKF